MYTLEKHREIVKRMGNGELTADEFYTSYRDGIKDDAAELKASLNGLTVAQLKNMARGVTGKKAQIVRQVAHSLLAQYTYPSPLGISGMMGERYLDMVSRAVEVVDQGMLDAYAAKVAERRAEREAALDDPQTMSDFRLFIRVHGFDALNLGQLERFDRLVFEEARTETERLQQQAARIRQIETDAEITITQDYHTKKQQDIWVAKLSERVPGDQFGRLRDAADKLGGYWSRFVGGFVFWAEDDAEQFVALQDGDGTAEDRWQRIAELREQRAAERLEQYADKHLDGAQGKLARERLTNTVRRVRMAQAAAADAREEEALARTVTNVANALERGELDALKGIRHVTQIAALRWLLGDAHRRACSEEAGGYVERGVMRRMRRSDIAYAKFPRPWVSRSTLSTLEDRVKGRKGTRGYTQVLTAVIQRTREDNANYAVIQSATEADCILHLAGICKDRYVRESVYTEMAGYKRLAALGIQNVFILRHTLREFYPLAVPTAEQDPIERAEQELVGWRIPGFFPTPENLVKQMIGYAGIYPGQTILEPSAGKGNIVEGVWYHLGGANKATVHCYETSSRLYDILRMKGAEMVGMDFTEAAPNPIYDRILMNPPFENNQDIEHVTHAYEFLKPGGVLVAIMSEHTFFANGRAAAFRAWMDQAPRDYHIEKLPSGSFEESGTGVNTRMVVLYKPD